MSSRSWISFPSRIIVISMAVAIIIGTLFLSLPAAQINPIPFIDLLFVATSSTCVTGLMTISIGNFTLFGKAIILVLIQIGGLGLITLTLFTISLFIDFGLSTQVAAGKMLSLDSWKKTRHMLVFIIMLTLIVEAIGAISIFPLFRSDHPFEHACLYALFHAISSFCNAGISLFMGGMRNYNQDATMIITTTILMLLGGIGFFTLRELITSFFAWIRSKKHSPLSLQSKIILSYTAFLTIGNTILFWLLEQNNTFEFMSTPYQWLNSFFMAVTSRSCGFLPVYANDLQLASIFLMAMNAFIGSAPGSTGSGVKITTAALFIGAIKSAIKGNTSVNIKGRRIMTDQVYRALAIVALSVFWIVFTTFCLLITEKSWHFIDVFFETISAFSTLGVSTGITPYLSVVGKIFIIFTMLIGRIGSLTLLTALQKHIEQRDFSYPKERVMIT